MKKLLCLLLVSLLLLLLLAGCAEEVSRKAVDVRHTPAREVEETDFIYIMDGSGAMRLIPVINTIDQDESYSILWCITYDDGSTKTRWLNCTYSEYIEVQKQLQNTTE